jgi:hypothetical protein
VRAFGVEDLPYVVPGSNGLVWGVAVDARAPGIERGVELVEEAQAQLASPVSHLPREGGDVGVVATVGDAGQGVLRLVDATAGFPGFPREQGKNVSFASGVCPLDVEEGAPSQAWYHW